MTVVESMPYTEMENRKDTVAERIKVVMREIMDAIKALSHGEEDE